MKPSELQRKRLIAFKMELGRSKAQSAKKIEELIADARRQLVPVNLNEVLNALRTNVAMCENQIRIIDILLEQ